MSSFSDNFKRDSEEDMLEYDDSAFYYFSISILSFILIPVTYYQVAQMLQGQFSTEITKGQCKCTACTARLNVKQRQARASIFTTKNLFKVACLGLVWYVWYLNAVKVASIESLQSFDPFAILDVPNDATQRDIKKQYRKLSLSMHPDKNPDNPLAVQEFIRLTRAYNILTDETAFENFKKYGNPDGPGSYNVGIAMPRFLLEQDNQVLFLCVAFFILLVVIPGLIYYNFMEDTQRDEGGVHLENKKHYGAKLNENMLVKNMPLMLAQSIEMQAMGAKNQEEVALLKKIKENEEIADLLPKTNSSKTAKMNLKPLLLLLAHCLRDDNVRNPIFQDSLNELLKASVFHTQMCMTVGGNINLMNRTGKSLKYLGVKAYQTLIQFQQYLVQGLWDKIDPMLQLPHFDEEVIKKYRKQLKDLQIPNGKIETFCRLSPEKRKQLNLFDDPSKMADVERAVRGMPLISYDWSVETEGEKMMTSQDVITFKITITYDLLQPDEEPGYVHSLRYPLLKKHRFWMVLAEGRSKEKIIVVDELLPERDPVKLKKDKPNPNTATYEIKQRFGQVGEVKFTCFLMSDSFVGFDKEFDIEFQLHQEDKSRVIKPYDAEDIAAVKGPSMVQSMLDMKAEDQSDEESSADEIMTLAEKLKAAGLKDAIPEKKEKENEKETANSNQLIK